MSEQRMAVNGLAHTANVDLVAVGAERLVHRQNGLPGFAVLYGPAGFGKTTVTTALCNKLRGYYVQMRSAWSRKALLEKILFEMSIKPHGTISGLLDQVCEQLAASRRLLVIDEFDYCTRNDNMIELVRDIHEGSLGSMLLVGEEQLPQKLKRWERFHGRVLTWLPAVPVNLDDARKLAAVYSPDVSVADDLLERLVSLSGGAVRRVVVNLTRVQEEALMAGQTHVDLATWGSRELYTGEAPKRRV